MAVEVVDTEVHIERQLVESTATGDIYAFRLVWEGSRVIEVRSFVPRGVEPDVCGLRELLRAVP